MFSAFIDWLKVATWHRYLIGLVSALTAIALFTVYENRQTVYSQIINPPRTIGDWELQPPGPAGQQLLQAYVKRRPNIRLLTVIDADPIRNRRVPIYRVFNSPELERYVMSEIAGGRDGSGLLWGTNEASNRQTLAIFNVEVLCDPADRGFFAKAFPNVTDYVATSCRVALPPIYEMTTGWIVIHFEGTVDADDPELKVELLNLAMAYYKAEILPFQK